MKPLVAYILILIPFLAFSQEKDSDPINYGGSKEFKRIFLQELNYPQASINKTIGGRVMIDVHVDSAGNVTKTEITEGVGKDVDAEALRIAELLLWDPAIKKGRKVAGVGELKFKFNPYKFATITNERGYQDAEYPKLSTNIVWKPVELHQEPSFDGKYDSFDDYVKEELVFPEEAKVKMINGYVKVFFVIEPNGRVTNIKLLEPLEGNCDVVAMDLIERSRWKPGQLSGLPVRSSRVEQLGFFTIKPKSQFYHSGEQTPNR